MKKWTASLLVYNEEMWLPYQLKQLEDCVDEIIITDGAFRSQKDQDVRFAGFGMYDDNRPSSDKTRNIIEAFKKKSKIRVEFLNAKGSQIDIRNENIKHASYDNILVIDADEYYRDLKKYLKEFDIAFNKGHDYVEVLYNYEFYFDFDHFIIQPPIYTAFRRNKNLWFISSRKLNSKKQFLHEGVCFHYSYIKTWSRMKEKVREYGVLGENWLNNIAKNFGKMSDEDLYNMNTYAWDSIHLLMKRKKFIKDIKLEHPEVVKDLVKSWKWRTDER